MNIWLIVTVVIVLAIIAYAACNTLIKAKVSAVLMEHAVAYKKETGDYARTMLVLGDSTGVGIGADKPEESVAGLVATYQGATHVENYAVSGAAVEELPGQIKQAKLKRYDLTLIHIGGNDILAFHDPKKTAERLSQILPTLPEAGRVVIMSAGNVGGATIFPWIIRPFHTWLTLQFHAAFDEVAARHHAVYINLYEPPHRDLFLKDPERYLAPDGLHPSSEGYALWFEKVKTGL